MPPLNYRSFGSFFDGVIFAMSIKSCKYNVFKRGMSRWELILLVKVVSLGPGINFEVKD